VLRTAALFVLLASTLHLAAQAPPIRIEVSSVRPHKGTGDDPSNRNVLPGGRFVATGTSVQTLIRSAFGLDVSAIVNAPGWTESETFDINAATADHVEITRPEQYQELLLALLQDRFGFRFHREPREGSVFWLVLDKAGKPGPSLKTSAPGTPLNLSMNGDRRVVMSVKGVTMTDVAKALQRRAGRTIEDRTGLQGTYDFQIQWAPEPSPDSDDPSLFTVLKEQLGLKLQPAKGPIETLVVDQVERPSAN
jgi:uncharacterized protein (TIGR03435 family)